MSSKIKFNYQILRGDRRHFINQEDCEVVLSRLPNEITQRIKRISFVDRGRGGHVLGYITPGRREISLCALPPRISLTRFLRRTQSPGHFGAVRGAQWPNRAIRRFILYDVLLHEIGHLQVIDEKAKSNSRKYADETRAQDFAEYWSAQLLNQEFDHPDPVHRTPSELELTNVQTKWIKAHGEYKKGLLCENRKELEIAILHFQKAIDLFPNHSYALEALGILSYTRNKTFQRSIGFLEKAIEHDPGLIDANLFLGLAYAEQNNHEKSLYYADRALKFSENNTAILSVKARLHADFGDIEKAFRLCQRAVNRSPEDEFVLFNFRRILLHPENKEREANKIKYSDLLSGEHLTITSDKFALNSRTLQVLYKYTRPPANSD